MKNNINFLKGPIFIFGASGFIGVNLFKLIIKYRTDVFAISRSSKSIRLQGINNSNIIILDIKDQYKLNEIISFYKPKTIFNLIAYGSYPFQDNINKIYKVNFHYLKGLVECLSRYEICSFINAGTSSEYGLNSNAPKEYDPLYPNSDYAISKLSFYYYLKYFAFKNNFPSIHLRLYSVYGELEENSRLIPTLLKQANLKKFPRLVNKDISRDFIYIDDVCEAFIMAAINIKPQMYGEVYNIGTGIKTTIEELAYLVKELFSIKSDPIFDTYINRKWDVTNWYSNPTKASFELKWKYNTSLKKGLLFTDEYNNK